MKFSGFLTGEPNPEDEAMLLDTPGFWRLIKDDSEDKPLPSRKGRLTAVRMNGGHWVVHFKCNDYSGQRGAWSVKLDDCGNLVLNDYGRGAEVVYGPASRYKRAPKLPIPPAPKLTVYKRHVVKDGNYSDQFTIHKVAVVEKWPDPNRYFNGEDALVRPRCSDSGGWVQPKNMQPRLDKTHLCKGCFPNYDC